MSEIDAKYQQLNGASFLGAPTEDERSCPDGVGRYRTYQHGSIHWHPSSGAHETHGSIRTKWASLGWEKGILGYPTSDERAAVKAEIDELVRLHGTSSADAARSVIRCSEFVGGRVFCWSPDGTRYFTTLITRDGQRTDEQHTHAHRGPHMGAEGAKAAGAAAAGAAAGYAVVAATGLTAAGAIGGGAGIGAAAGPVGAALGAIAGLAVYGIYRIVR